MSSAEFHPRSRQKQAARILLVDDHDVVRQGLRALIEARGGFEICGEVVNGREAVEVAASARPDIVVLDISMPELNGIEAARHILRDRPQSRVIVLTMHNSDELLNEALSIGVQGYVLKSDAANELMAAINAAAAGKFFMSSGVAGHVMGSARNFERKPSTRKARLTPREREIVQMLAEGKTSKEIAADLSLAVKTVETHRTNILRKLDCHSIAEVVLYAVRNKIVEA